MTKTSLACVLLASAACACLGQRIEVTIPSTRPLNGHLILVIAKSDKAEPRMQLSETYDSAEGFGVDAENLAPGTPLIVDAKTFGYPRRPAHRRCEDFRLPPPLPRRHRCRRLLPAGCLQHLRAIPSRLG